VNVHVVCADFNSDRILPRIARVLSGVNGWPVGETPNGRADVNLFIVYIEFAESNVNFKDTPVAAWFSHYEEDYPQKQQWWDTAAEKVDLRLTCAKMYADKLAPFGRTAQVRPPLDRGAFVIKEKLPTDKPAVGISGFVTYKGHRKGQELVGKLANSKLGRSVELRATGQGWPVRIQSTRPVEKLPEFYQNLDVFLCTSLVEGIPMPPLEALACGVPVVVPAGVGMMDELPDVAGIYRFPRGDFNKMRAALAQALDERHDLDREALRAVTEPFTNENWAGDVRLAVEGLLFDVPNSKPKGGKRGVYYVAFGEPSRRCAKHAVETFKAHMPGVEVALASTEPLGVEDHFVKHDEVDIGGRAQKTKIYSLTPKDWEFVLYLDADTEVIADISFLYYVLADGGEMVICKNPGRFHVCANMVRPDNHDECAKTFAVMGTKEATQLNGGVFGFRRCERVRLFFEAWHEEWQRWGKRDQAALLRALWRHPLRLYVLGNEWNTVTRYMPAERSAGILHYPQKARRWEGLIDGRADGKDAWKLVKQWEAKKR
jgi:hypothetical protein